MKKIYLLAMMLCLLILPATAMAAPSANATAFANEEALSNQWIDSMLVKKDSAAALNIMSADAKKNVKAAEMQKAQERMSKELGTLKEGQDVDVVARDRPLQDLDLVRPADFAHQFSETNPDLADQDTLAVLGDPDEVVLQVEAAMRAGAVVLHVEGAVHTLDRGADADGGPGLAHQLVHVVGGECVVQRPRYWHPAGLLPVWRVHELAGPRPRLRVPRS